MAKKKRIYVPVSDEDQAIIKKIAKESFRSVAYVAAYLLKNAVDDSKK